MSRANRLGRVSSAIDTAAGLSAGADAAILDVLRYCFRLGTGSYVGADASQRWLDTGCCRADSQAA
jgi:hypothetical protein